MVSSKSLVRITLMVMKKLCSRKSYSIKTKTASVRLIEFLRQQPLRVEMAILYVGHYQA